ncbi:MAG TPA: response regulator transcription factor [Intrasporangiaceae bacterium]|nr:response regulator transcription factor [Intrasporangiaceae bacterium]
MRVLLAEDESRIVSFVQKGLSAEGIAVTVATDGAAALALALSEDFDVMVLDIGLPVLDGFTVLARLRATGSELPVIVLTARDSAQDTIRGLTGGADDYVAKPFSFGELLARIRLRARPDPGSSAGPGELHITAGELRLDLARRQVAFGDAIHDLSAREFALLRVLAEHHRQVLSRTQLLEHVWDMDFDPGSNVVDVYIRYLRQKLGAQAIETVRGMGYRLVT